MRPIPFIAVFCTILLANPSAFQLAAAPTAAKGSSLDDTPDRLFAWFDTLGYPDISQAEFVKVRSGSTNVIPENEPEYEFLLAEDATTFTTLSLIRLSSRTLPKGRPKELHVDWYAFETADLAAYINGQLKRAAEVVELDSRDRHPLDQQVVLRAQLFVLARVAYARKLNDQVKELLGIIPRQPQPGWLNEFEFNHPGNTLTATVKERLANDLAYSETWNALNDFGRSDAGYAPTLARLQRIEALFPQFVRRAEVVDAVGRFQRMIRRDEAHARQEAEQAWRPLGELPPQAQIDEWIYRLRDNPGASSYCGEADPKDDSPAHKIARFGLRAIPQLIEAIEDDGFLPWFHSSVGHELIWPPTIGEAAEMAIGQVAGRSFAEDDWRSDQVPTADDRAARRKLVEAWFADVHRRGLKAVLVDGTRSAESYSAHQAARLALRYPGDAAAPILEGAAKARRPPLRAAMVRELAAVPVGRRPHELARSRDGRFGYATLYGLDLYTETVEGGRTVAIVDLEKREKVGEIDLEKFRRPHGIEVGPQSGLLYVTCDHPAALLVINPTTRKIVRAIELADKGALPHMTAVSHDESIGFTANCGSASVTMIDLKSGLELKQIPIGGVPMGMAVTPDGRTLYAVNRTAEGIAVIDAQSGKLERILPVPGQPVRVSVTPDGTRLLATCIAAGDCAIIDTASQQIVGRVPIGNRVEGLAVDPTGRIGFASAQADDRVIRFTIADARVRQAIKANARPDPLLLLPAKKEGSSP